MPRKPGNRAMPVVEKKNSQFVNTTQYIKIKISGPLCDSASHAYGFRSQLGSRYSETHCVSLWAFKYSYMITKHPCLAFTTV